MRRETSKRYFDSCNRLHRAINMFYEGLHDPDGDPVDDLERVASMALDVRSIMNIELDLTKELCREYSEHNERMP